MGQLSIVWESPCDFDGMRRQLADAFELKFISINRIRNFQPEQYTVIDSGLGEAARLQELKEWLSRKPRHGKVICVVDKASHIEATRAFAIGANDIVHRPLKRDDLLSKIWGDFTELSRGTSDFHAADAEGVVAAADALKSIFSVACVGGHLDAKALNSAGEQVIAQIGVGGLAP